MVTKRTLLISGTAIAVAFAGHGALDAFADQKAAEAIERIRAQLPDGSVLSYRSIDGDPYSTGATIDGLEVTHPTLGTTSIATVVIAGTELDDQGRLAGIGSLDLVGIALASPEPLDIIVGALNVQDLAGDGLQRLMARDFSYQALAALDFSEIAVTRVSAKNGDGELKVATFSALKSDDRQAAVEVEGIAFDALEESALLSIDQISWQGILLDGEGPVPAVDDPEPFLALLPSTFDLSRLTLTTPEVELELAGLTSTMARSGARGAEVNYAFNEARIVADQLPATLGNSLSVVGKTDHDFGSGITQGTLKAEGAALADADVAFNVRGMSFLPGFFAGMPTPAQPDQSPAIVSLSIDYRDQGIASYLFDNFAGTTAADRNALANQMEFLGGAMLGGKLPDSLQPIIQESREFLLDPQTLRIAMTPQAPVDIANLTLAALMNPGGLPQLLGLTVLANE